MDEENQNDTTVNANPPKKGGTAKKIIIAVVAIILVAAIVIGILLATGVIDINLNNKSKMEAGVDQLIESYSDPADKVMENAEKNGATTKVANHITAGQPIDVSAEISADIEELSVSSVSASDKAMMDKVKNLLNDISLSLNAKYDGSKQVHVNAQGKVGDVSLSGDAVYDGNQLGLHSEELNSKWLTLTNEQIKQLASQNGVDAQDLEEKLQVMTNELVDLSKSMEVDEKTQEEIQERYKKVFKDFIKEKSKNIKTKSAKVEVDGKKKSCTKLTLEFDEEDVKDLLKDYIDTLSKDEQTKGIINNYLNGLQEATKSTGASSSQNIADQFNTLLSNTDSMKSAIDQITFDGKVILEVYGTMTNTYRTDIIFEAEDENVASIETTFNNKETVTRVVVQDKEFAKATLTSDDNSIALKIETSDEAKSLIGEKVTLEVNFKTEPSKAEFNLSASTENSGTVKLNVTENIDKNEDTEYAGTTTINLDVDSPEIVAKMSINLKMNLKTEGVEIPSIPRTESLDLTNQTDVQTYMTEAQTKLTELQQKLSQVESVKAFMNSTSNESF